MDLRVEKNEFLQGLYLTQGVVEKRNTLPILANVLIEPTASDIALTATDLEVGIRKTCRRQGRRRPGSITLNARKLYEIVRELPADEVVLRTGAGRLGRGQRRQSALPHGVDGPKDFPSIPLSTPVAKKSGGDHDALRSGARAR